MSTKAHNNRQKMNQLTYFLFLFFFNFSFLALYSIFLSPPFFFFFSFIGMRDFCKRARILLSELTFYTNLLNYTALLKELLAAVVLHLIKNR